MHYRSQTKGTIFKLGAAALLVGFIAIPASDPSPLSGPPAEADMTDPVPAFMAVTAIAAPPTDAPPGLSLHDKFHVLLLDPHRIELPTVETSAARNIRTLLNHEHFPR